MNTRDRYCLGCVLSRVCLGSWISSGPKQCMTSWKWWGLWILRRSHGGVRVPGHVFVCGTLCPWQYQKNTLLNTTQYSQAPSGIRSEAGEIQLLIIPNVKSDNHSEWEPYNICKPLGRWNVTYRHFSSKSYSPGNFPYDKNSLISDDGMLRFTEYRFIVKNLLKFLSWSPTWGFKSYLKKRPGSRKKGMDWYFVLLRLEDCELHSWEGTWWESTKCRLYYQISEICTRIEFARGNW